MRKIRLLSGMPLTSAVSWSDGCAVVLEVQGTGRMQHGVHKDVGLALLQHVQHLLRG